MSDRVYLENVPDDHRASWRPRDSEVDREWEQRGAFLLCRRGRE